MARRYQRDPWSPPSTQLATATSRVSMCDGARQPNKQRHWRHVAEAVHHGFQPRQSRRLADPQSNRLLIRQLRCGARIASAANKRLKMPWLNTIAELDPEPIHIRDSRQMLVGRAFHDLLNPISDIVDGARLNPHREAVMACLDSLRHQSPN